MFDTIFSAISIVLIAAVFVLYILNKSRNESNNWVYVLHFIIVVVTGTVLYDLGLSYSESGTTMPSFVYVLNDALAATLRSFGAYYEMSSVAKLADTNILFAIAIFLNYIGAVTFTGFTAIRLFGKNTVSRLKVFVNSFFSRKIVIGCNDQAQIFLKNLRDRRQRTTVILEPDNKTKLADLVEDGYAVLVIRDEENGDHKDDLTAATAEALRRAGAFREKHSTDIIAMSESDEQNLCVAKIVTEHVRNKIPHVKNKKGITLSEDQAICLRGIKLRAFIMYSFWDRTAHFIFTDHALGRVRFFNPYEMRARKFAIENPITTMIPPVWIDTQKARLNKAYGIGNIFVGFGRTNEQILRKSICNNQLLGIDYNALVIDKNAKTSEKRFKNDAVGLFRPELNSKNDENGKSRYFDDPKEKNKIGFEEYDVLSLEFYDRVCSEIESKDFITVIIALGDDKLSIETALELRHKLYERDLLTDKDDGHPKVVMFVKIMERSILSDEGMLNYENTCKIKTFGEEKEILNEEYIIEEKLDELAKRIADNYCDDSSEDVAQFTKWDALPRLERDSNRYAAMSIRTKLNLLGFELKESAELQDPDVEQAYCDVYDMKLADMQHAAVEKQWNNEDFSGDYVDFPKREGNAIADTARNNLARLEHQRWISFYLSNGWTKLEKTKVTADTRKDPVAKQHACLTVFEDLEELRDMQSEAHIPLLKEKIQKRDPTKAEVETDKEAEVWAKSEADVIRYDFFLMDKLFRTLKSRYIIIKK